MSLFSDYSSSSEMHNNLTIDYYLALSSTKGSGITNIISIIPVSYTHMTMPTT
mgnify:CR=1 FL=1